MLGKLMKYEFKATSRLLVPMYLAVIVFSFVNRLFLSIPEQNIQNDIISGLLNVIRVTFILGLVLLIFASFFVTFIIMIRRFYTNLLCDEGYLMHTLPVKPYQHIFSKLFVSVVWNLVNFLVIILSLFILLATPVRLDNMYNDLHYLFAMMQSEFSSIGVIFSTADIVLYVVEILLLLIVSSMSGNLLMYASMSFGHLFNRRRVLYSVAGYLGLSFIVQFITSIGTYLITAICFVVNDSGGDIMIGFLEDHTLLFFHGTLWVGIISGILFALIYYFITHFVMKKRLNLQ